MKMMLLTGLPVAGTVIILVFSCLCRKTNLRGREDTRSGTEKQCSHNLFHTPLGGDMSSVYITAVVWSELIPWMSDSCTSLPSSPHPHSHQQQKYFVLYCLPASPLPPLNKTALQANLPTGNLQKTSALIKTYMGGGNFL